MNILTGNLPTKIRVKDKIFDINTDFRVIINILLAFEDSSLSREEQFYVAINNLYKKEIPNDYLDEAIKQAIKFINGGEEDKSIKMNEKRIYSFTKDGNRIFSGINQTHKRELEKETYLHWWVFLSLFMDMSPDCMFGELTYYRKRKNEGKLTKEEKDQYKKIKTLVDLDDDINEGSEARKNFFKKYKKLHS